MKTMKNYLALVLVASAPLIAAGRGGGGETGGDTGGGTTPATSAEVRTTSARVPAGGTFQAQFLLTQPRPIGSGGSSMATDSFDVNGVAIFSPLGDAAGAATWQNGQLTVNVVSPLGDYGTNLDYPYMVVTMTSNPATLAGSMFPLGLLSANYTGSLGPLTLTDPKPGVLTIGGSVSIHNITPGGGTWPAGTIVKVQGTGFSSATKLTAKMRMSPITYVSPTELDFTLLDSATTMDMLALTAQNPDGSQVTYFSYLRGTLVASPSRSLLLHTDPVFQAQTHSLATFTIPSLAGGQFAAISVQNPTPGPVDVALRHYNSGLTKTFTLQFGARIMDEVSALLGTSVNPGDTVIVNATSGVQILGLTGDEIQGTVNPFLPVF